MKTTGRVVRRVSQLAFFGVAMLLGAHSAAAQCDKVADSQLVSTIYGKIKGDKGLAKQISHINVVAVNGAVKFQGWADSKSNHEKIVGFAMDTACVKMVNVNDFAEAPPAAGNQLRSESGCAPGTKPCGDVCIPEGDPCNITEFSGWKGPMFGTPPWSGRWLFDRLVSCR